MSIILNEVSRSAILNKSINAKPTKTYGTTRYERRRYQKIDNSVATFNKLDCNSLFKTDILTLQIPVTGETDDYIVTVVFDGVCKDIQRELKKNKFILEYKIIYKAIVRAINNQNIFIGCTCNDYKFRFQYIATKQRFNALKAQLIPANITNPNDDKGAGCKHIMSVLGDLNWAMQLSTAVYNYIVYMKDNMNDLYIRVMFRQIYGMPYDVAIKKGVIQEDSKEELDNPTENVPEEEIDNEQEELL